MRCRNCRSMIGGDVACWTVAPGKGNASHVNGPAWQMWRSNTTGVLLRSSASRVFAMVRRTANGIRWESPGLFLIKTAGRFTMRDGSMISVRKTVMMKNKERYQIEAVPLREKH